MPKSAKLDSTEVARALHSAIEAALAAVLQEKKKKKPVEPPPPSNEVEQQIANAAAGPTKPPPRDRHGFRGTPPPADFSLTELPDDSLLTEYEVAALARLSTNTLAAWRKRERDHPLKWTTIRGGRVRYRAGDVRQFIGAVNDRGRGAPGRRRTPRLRRAAPPVPPTSDRRRRDDCRDL